VFDDQHGVVTRAQALAGGMTIEAIRAQVRAGRWQRLSRSVYATFNGPVPREYAMWAAALRAGQDAVLSHQSAGELAGLVDEAHPLIHVSVPSSRRVRGIAGVAIHYSLRVVEARHPLRTPPQTRVEETVVDLTQAAASVEQALGWIARACGRRLTRADRIARAVEARKKVRWRDELLAATADVAAGSHSSLELRYLRDVERAHALPRGNRQHAVGRRGGRFYEDVRYVEFGVVVELDGRAAHPDEARWRDMRRDNLAVVNGGRVLRYGWADVTGEPCAVATQVVAVLREAGWRAPARRCGPVCTAHFP
jgi:very-short-patch-repair endonuclease